MPAQISDVMSQFKKTEIRSICEELSIVVDLGERSVDMINKIYSNLDIEGIPEAEDCSDLLFAFLVTAEYMDESGGLIAVVKSNGSKPEATADQVDINELPKPRCFSLADVRDPSCSRCRVLSLCLKERERRRPECFGKHYDQHAPECQACIEAVNCKPISIQFQKES